MFALVLAAAPSFLPVMAPPPTPSVVRRTGAVVMAGDSELAMLNAMSDSFWKQKRARMKAELAAQLLELDEFEARERALQEVAARGGGGGGAGAPSLQASELQALLEAEQAKTAALEAELAQKVIEAEVSLQKVAAFWCASHHHTPPTALLDSCLFSRYLCAIHQSPLISTPPPFLTPPPCLSSSLQGRRGLQGQGGRRAPCGRRLHRARPRRPRRGGRRPRPCARL